MSDALTPGKVSFARSLREVPLEHPLDVDGIVYDRVGIRPLRANEVQEFVIETFAAVENGTAGPELAMFMLLPEDKTSPMITGVVMSQLAQFLTEEDLQEVNNKSVDFLPRRLRQAAEPIPPTSEDTSSTSAPSSTPPSPTPDSSTGES